jgi:hypothetical protein
MRQIGIPPQQAFGLPNTLDDLFNLGHYSVTDDIVGDIGSIPLESLFVT